MTDPLRPKTIEVGDRVRIDIPDETDPDFRHHGDNGEVIAVIEDEASSVTGGRQDDNLYRIHLDSGDTIDVRRRDLRPPI